MEIICKDNRAQYSNWWHIKKEFKKTQLYDKDEKITSKLKLSYIES